MVTKNLFYKIYTYYKLSPSKYSPLSLTHFSILFFHPSIQSRKASSGMRLSSAVVAFWMASTSPKCVPFSTCFNLGKGKNHRAPGPENRAAVPTRECFFPPETAGPRPKKARQSKSKVKLMLIAFFDVRGIVHTEFLPQGQTVNQHVYKDVLRRLIRSVRDKRRELWVNDSWVLHHDNAPAHNALSVRQFLAENNIPVLEQPPYSPDLAPCGFFLLPKLKQVPKGTYFGDVEAIQKAATAKLKRIPEEAFRDCIEGWKIRMEKRVRLNREYFEGESL